MSVATTAYWFFRRHLFDRDGGRCGICGDPVALKKMDIDHIVQLTDGGSDDPSNLRVAHPRCNRSRPRILGPRIMVTGLPLSDLVALKEWAASENFEFQPFIIHTLKRMAEKHYRPAEPPAPRA